MLTRRWPGSCWTAWSTGCRRRTGWSRSPPGRASAGPASAAAVVAGLDGGRAPVLDGVPAAGRRHARGDRRSSTRPALSLAVVVAGLVAAGVLVAVRWIRSGLAGHRASCSSPGRSPFQVTGVTLVALLAVLLPVGGRSSTAGWRGSRTTSASRRCRRLVAVRTRSRPPPGPSPGPQRPCTRSATFLDPTSWGRVTPPSAPVHRRARPRRRRCSPGQPSPRPAGSAPMALRRVAVIAAIVDGRLGRPVRGLRRLRGRALGRPRRPPPWRRRAGTAGAAVAYAGLAVDPVDRGRAVAFGIVARPDRLWVVDTSLVASARRSSPGWPLAFVALALAAVRWPRGTRCSPAWRTWLEVTSGIAARVRRVGRGRRRLPAAGRRARRPSRSWPSRRRSRSACAGPRSARRRWSSGCVRHRPMLRHAGFALLGLATAKVVRHRPGVDGRGLPGRSSWPGSGSCSWLSAYLFTHFRGPRSGPPGSREDRDRLT